MPPLVSAWGQLSLIRRTASMNQTAYRSCSSMPVATAKTLGSKTMSSGGKPSSSTRIR